VDDDPRGFFEERGYEIEFAASDGTWWATLRKGSFVVERYGRGETKEAAARRAAERWRTEQGE
jgi:hypothetical protein